MTAATTPVLAQLLDSLTDAAALPTLDLVPNEALIQAATSAAPAVVALAVRDRDRAGDRAPLVVVTATGGDAETFQKALGAYLDPATVAFFPSWETLPHERLSPRSDTVARRLATLRRVVHPQDVERLGGVPHGFPVRRGPHDDPDRNHIRSSALPFGPGAEGSA